MGPIQTIIYCHKEFLSETQPHSSVHASVHACFLVTLAELAHCSRYPPDCKASHLCSLALPRKQCSDSCARQSLFCGTSASPVCSFRLHSLRISQIPLRSLPYILEENTASARPISMVPVDQSTLGQDFSSNPQIRHPVQSQERLTQVRTQPRILNPHRHRRAAEQGAGPRPWDTRLQHVQPCVRSRVRKIRVGE